MDKNKIITILVALSWLAVVVLKTMGKINLGQYRIILLVLVGFYAVYFYSTKNAKKK